MSTDYLPRLPIPFDQIKGLDIEGAKEHQTPDTGEGKACLTDGENYLWAVKTSLNYTWFSRYGGNFVDGILDVLANHFGADFVSEHDDDWEEALKIQSVEGLDYINIQLPTPDDPGPWKQVYP